MKTVTATERLSRIGTRVFENRYFHHSIRNNTVTYLQKIVSLSHLHMHWNPRTAASQGREYAEQRTPPIRNTSV